MSDVAHLIQDLRADAHRCPADVAPRIRRAAALLEQALLEAAFGREVRAAPVPPPGPDPRDQVRVKGAPCA